MTAHRVEWVTALRPVREPLAPVCDDELIGEATAKLGTGPVAWAVEVGNEIAHAHEAAYPNWAVSDPQLLTSRRGPESATLLTLITLVDGVAAVEPVRADARLMIRDFVHRRIPLEEFLQAVTAGYAWLNRLLVDACEQLVVPDLRMEHTQLVLRLVSEFIQRFMSEMISEYTAELERWTATDVAVREELVRQVLAQGDLDMDAVARKLSYRVDLRYHRALVLWSEGVGTASAGSLERFAAQLMDSRGLRQRLMVPMGLSELWCWVTRPGPGQDDEAVRMDLPEGVGMAAGQVHRGRGGFRRSLKEALSAQRVAQVGPWSSGRSVPFVDAALWGLLLENLEAATDFVVDELAGLVADDDSTAALRETLSTFLTTHSPSATAAQMFIARNTVAYRLRRAEAVLPRPVATRGTELGIALRLLQILPSAQIEMARMRAASTNI